MNRILEWILVVDKAAARLESWYYERNMNEPTSVPGAPIPPVVPNPDALLPWTSIENNRHNVRAIADLQGLTEQQKNNMSQTIHCESGYRTDICNINLTDKTTRQCSYSDLQATYIKIQAEGLEVSSTDFGICQWNDWFHGKEITPDESINNPQMAVELMCSYVKSGQLREWVCWNKGLAERYTP
jgi:hypothetical protein